VFDRGNFVIVRMLYEEEDGEEQIVVEIGRFELNLGYFSVNGSNKREEEEASTKLQRGTRRRLGWSRLLPKDYGRDIKKC
jgi:hypothetical protein